jgi:ATP synthase in type III secretion protein N
VKGNDAVGDEAIEKIERIKQFLNQATENLLPFEETVAQLSELARP